MPYIHFKRDQIKNRKPSTQRKLKLEVDIYQIKANRCSHESMRVLTLRFYKQLAYQHGN